MGNADMAGILCQQFNILRQNASAVGDQRLLLQNACVFQNLNRRDTALLLAGIDLLFVFAGVDVDANPKLLG